MIKRKLATVAIATTCLLGFGTVGHAEYGGKVSLKNSTDIPMPTSQMYGQSGIDGSGSSITFKGKTYSTTNLGNIIAYANVKLYNSSGTLVSSVNNSQGSSTAVASKKVSVTAGKKYTVKTSHMVEVFNRYGGTIPPTVYRGNSSYSKTP